MTLVPGSRLGPYEILAPIGAGGMGEVYKARDTRLDRVVAIKVLPSHLAERPDLRERFEREAKAISSLSHPNICTLFDTFQYMAPEQLEGAEADARSDVFALGSVLYEMATGRPAFQGKSRASLISAIMSSEPQPLMASQPLAPPALERVIRTCLAKD